MKLLAFETATEACSVALWIDGDVHERFELAPRRHAALALPWADALLADAGLVKSQLDAIAVGRGPGAFTGVRLAIAVAQGIALALDRPVVPVSTLAALAMRSSGERVIAAIDARMGEVYVGAFVRGRQGGMSLVGPEVVAKAGAVAIPGGLWSGVGTGFGAVDGALAVALQDRVRDVDATALPHAADVARIAAVAYAAGEVVAAERLEPAYLRNDVALTLQQQQALRASR